MNVICLYCNSMSQHGCSSASAVQVLMKKPRLWTESRHSSFERAQRQSRSPVAIVASLLNGFQSAAALSANWRASHEADSVFSDRLSALCPLSLACDADCKLQDKSERKRD